MAQSRTLFIGMDVHKAASAVAYVAQEHGAEVPSLGASGTRQCDIDQLLRQRHAKAQPLVFVYDAGPCGYWLYRYLTQKAYACGGVAPSLRPTKAGDRVQTDRRDAVQWARLARSGALPLVSVPKVAAAAMRAGTRAREEPLSALQDAKRRRTACLLRPASRYPGQATGNPAPLRWLSEVVCPTPAPPIVFQAYVRAVPAHPERLQRLDAARQARGTAWRLHPVGAARPALRGVQGTVAVPTGAESGDLTRCDPPRERMPFLGLLPSEDSRGERRRHGARTKAGHPHARRTLGAGAGAYRDPAQGSRPRQLRLATQPKAIPDLRGTAQVRLCTRYRQLLARGKPANQGVVAMAREVVGCRWAMATAVPVTPSGQKTAHHAAHNSQGVTVHRPRRRAGVVAPATAFRGP